MKSKIPNKVIVIGGNHHNGLGIIRSLGEFGCRVFLIATTNRKSYVVKSRYIENYWYADSEDNVINILLNEFKNDKIKPIIIPGDDYSESIIDKNINRLKGKFIFPSINEKENAVLNKMNKIEMNKLAKKYGLLVPKSCIVNLKEIQNVNQAIMNMDIQYPCIIKPMKSIDGCKNDISINKNSTIFKKNIEKLKTYYSEVLIQEFIYKEGELGIEGLTTINSKEIIIPGVIKKLRQSTIALGSTTYAKLVKTNSLIDVDKIKLLIKDLGYTGIFDMELMYTEDKIYFIELNFRNGAYGYAFTKAGINIPLLWCLDAIELDISEKSKEIKKEVILMSETADFRNVLEKKISFFKWLMQFIKSDVHLIVNKMDIKPFIYKFLYR